MDFSICWRSQRRDRRCASAVRRTPTISVCRFVRSRTVAPGQVEMSFDPIDGIHSADAMILFRAATKQVCRRLGFHASFMCKPKLPGAYSSGWHLHQSLASAESGTNSSRQMVLLDRCSISENTTSEDSLSTREERRYSQLLRSTDIAASSRTRWRRRERPGRSTIARPMIRVQGRVGDPGSHIENRSGEPTANPYLYMASQLIAGLTA